MQLTFKMISVCFEDKPMNCFERTIRIITVCCSKMKFCLLIAILKCYMVYTYLDFCHTNCTY